MALCWRQSPGMQTKHFGSRFTTASRAVTANVLSQSLSKNHRRLNNVLPGAAHKSFSVCLEGRDRKKKKNLYPKTLFENMSIYLSGLVSQTFQNH